MTFLRKKRQIAGKSFVFVYIFPAAAFDMKIAIEGCAHGELQQIYDTIEFIQSTENVKVDLLICCGDFQASRNLNDLNSMAIPKKFHDICTFYKWVDDLS